MRIFRLVMLDGGYWLTKHESREALYDWLGTLSIKPSDETLCIDPHDVIQVIETSYPEWERTPLKRTPGDWSRYFPPSAQQ